MGRIAALRSREPLQCALIAACCALAVLLLAPPAQDLAAHVYRATLVDQGVVLWDNYWYAGDYPFVSYSVLAPVPAAVVGVVPLLVASTTASALPGSVLVGGDTIAPRFTPKETT